ncbi:regulatory protein RecX [Halieaceae bacterium IMCC14734]|uniref:Regulatory protein RecX n=1 Tax=Candidatus Litorirhabdus singularis TaxID=2518993 RepID=A0ABT3TIH8_9GAMM|nr:regulatory protein RecX [Candidatus Litorirhabdus singularis]MCX2982123.1 regulatory protein RecX [Candidatus Litorirhabdus singularis]
MITECSEQTENKVVDDVSTDDAATERVVTERVVAEEALNPADVRYAAMDLLARREHLQRELETKLFKRFGDLPDAREVIAGEVARLTAENLQSDERYCEAYVTQRSARGYGPERIEAELSQKGADENLIDSALQLCEVDWRELAQQVRLKKFGPALPEDWPAKSKQLRFLQYRGFSADQLSSLYTDFD